MQPYYINIARMMLDLGEYDLFPLDLYKMLSDAESYCDKTNGALVSRQIVASIIVFWKNKY